METASQPSFYRRALIALWVIFIFKGAFYCILFPMWEGFDEYAHFAFVEFAASHRELPVPETTVSRDIEKSLELVPLPWLLRQWPPPHVTHDAYWQLPAQERLDRERQLPQLQDGLQNEAGASALYEGKQGPLYYWLMVPLQWAMHNLSLPSRVLLFRLINIFLASTIIPIAFVAGQTLFRDDFLAFCGCALLAAMPELYIDASRVGNQTLSMVLYGVLTFLCLRALDREPQYFAIGATLGLLLLTKAYALAAIPAVGLVLIWKAWHSKTAVRSWSLVAASLACSAALAGWWYIRNFQLVGALVWVDGAPARPMRLVDLVRYIPRVKWLATLRSLAGSHSWFGNWSFLVVRSWMYETLELLILLCVAGLALTAVRSIRQAGNSISAPKLTLVLLLYGGFLAALAYHVLVNFINTGLGASSGWYLYAVAVPEALLAVAGIMAFRRRMNVLLLSLIGCLAALELYATNWLLIPYYTGLIAHTPAGALQSFHPARANLTFVELLARMHVNRPPFITDNVVLILWMLYVAGTVGVFYVAARCSVGVSSGS